MAVIETPIRSGRLSTIDGVSQVQLMGEQRFAVRVQLDPRALAYRRIGLDEVHSFVTLITQSIDLGSSVTDALRVYSDDMRHKRLSRAEEKAYALPAKLALPMMACIFPVLFVVILLPVFVRLHTGNF